MFERTDNFKYFKRLFTRDKRNEIKVRAGLVAGGYDNLSVI